MKKWITRLIAGVLLVAVSLMVGGAVVAVSQLPDLQPWHQLVSRLEPRAGDITSAFTLDDYLAREDAVFREAEATVDAVVSAGADAAVPNRYVTASRSYPTRLGTNWNRTQVLTTSEPRGGALLIHGLTDSPYSMRALAARLHAQGYYTLSLRMQGHGTVPGGLVNVDVGRLGWRRSAWARATCAGRSAPTGRWSSWATPTAARSSPSTRSTRSRTRRLPAPSR